MEKRKALVAEDVATGLQLQAMLGQAVAQVEAAQQMMVMWVENIRARYGAAEGEGWRLERWTDGFVREEKEDHGTEDDQ